MDEKSQKLYAKVAKYGGWKQVPAEAVHSIFEEIIDPARLGFLIAKRGYLARRIDDDITHVLKLDHLKGGACGIAYGASLSYLPYPYVPSLRWHRTLRSASLDLCEQPQVDRLDLNAASHNAESYIATTMLGEKCFREEFRGAWQRASPRILAWFDSARTLEGILARCAEQLSRQQLGVRRIPGPRLVRAFTLARLSQLSDARIELDHFLEEYQQGNEARANLSAALDQVRPR